VLAVGISTGNVNRCELCPQTLAAPSQAQQVAQDAPRRSKPVETGGKPALGAVGAVSLALAVALGALVAGAASVALAAGAALVAGAVLVWLFVGAVLFVSVVTTVSVWSAIVIPSVSRTIIPSTTRDT
jgi:hypothetical protein